MNGIILLINVFVIIVSAVAAAEYYSRRSSRRGEAKRIIAEREPVREMRDDEAAACASLHKGAGMPRSGAGVYRVAGAYSRSELRARGSSEVTHYVSGVELRWLPALERALRGDNEAEVALDERGRAVVLSLNGRYSILDEARAKAALTGAAPLTIGETTMAPLSRPLSDEERRYLAVDVRWPVQAALLVAAIVPLAWKGEAAAGISFALAAAAFVALFWSGYPAPRVRRPSVSLVGTPSLDAGGRSYAVGRWTVVVPTSWLGLVPGDAPVAVAGVVRADGLTVAALEIGRGLSVDADAERSRPVRYGRFAVASAMLAAALIVYAIAGVPVGDTARIAVYERFKDEPETIASFDDLMLDPLQAGRRVELPDLRVVDLEDGAVVVDPDARLELGLDGVYARLDSLEEFLASEDSYNALAVAASSYETALSILLKAKIYASGRRFNDFEPIFGESERFQSLIAAVDAVDASDEPSDGEWAAYEAAYKYFLREEAERLSDEVKAAVEAALAGTRAIGLELSGGYGYEGDEGPSVRYVDLDERDLRVIDASSPSSTQPGHIAARSRIEEYAATYATDAPRISIDGIVASTTVEDSDFRTLYLDLGADYDDLPDRARPAALFWLTACGSCVLAAAAVVGALRARRREAILAARPR